MLIPGQTAGILDECSVVHDSEHSHIYGILLALHLIQYLVTAKMFANIENMKTF